MFSSPAFAWPHYSTVKMSHKMLAKLDVLAEGLTPLGHMPGLLGYAADQIVEMLQTKKVSFLPFPIPILAAFFSLMVFLTGHRLPYPNDYISIMHWGQYWRRKEQTEI